MRVRYSLIHYLRNKNIQSILIKLTIHEEYVDYFHDLLKKGEMEGGLMGYNCPLSIVNYSYILSGTSIPNNAIPFLMVSATLLESMRRKALRASFSSLSIEKSW